MKKFLILFNLLIINLAFTQVSFKVTNLRTIDHNRYLLNISIINESNKKMAIPLDTAWFKGYFSPKICPTFEDIEYPYLAPVILIKDLNKQHYIEAKSGNLGYIDKSLIKTDPEHQQNRNIIINLWMKKENIKDYSSAMINFYLKNNILLIQPKETFSYEAILDISQIKHSKDSALYDEYTLNDGESYNISLIFCVDKNIYNYLTSTQIKSLKKYKLFTGEAESNNFTIKY
jgi:hypothetical protein